MKSSRRQRWRGLEITRQTSLPNLCSLVYSAMFGHLDELDSKINTYMAIFLPCAHTAPPTPHSSRAVQGKVPIHHMCCRPAQPQHLWRAWTGNRPARFATATLAGDKQHLRISVLFTYLSTAIKRKIIVVLSRRFTEYIKSIFCLN